MPPLYLCEYLPRLQKISVHLELDRKFHKLKNIALTETSLVLTFGVQPIHTSNLPPAVERISVPLPYPGRLTPEQARIENIVPRNGALSIDVACDGDQPRHKASNFMNFSHSKNMWSVRDLLDKTPRNKEGVNEFSFLCAKCGWTLLASRSYKFVDMPSEFWHEMMDFWHCHKPHEEHHNHNQKNYDGKIEPRPGFVNIGASYLQVAGLDSHCTNCKSSLGEVNGNIVQIYKWRLRLAYDGKIESYPPYLFVYFALLDKINSCGTRKFALTTPRSSEHLAVWVTSVGIDVSLGGHTLSDCLKILYRKGGAEADDVLALPAEVWDAFEALLSETNAMLPELQREVHMVEAEQNVAYMTAYLCSQPGVLAGS